MSRLGMPSALAMALMLNLVACGRDVGPVIAESVVTSAPIRPATPVGVVLDTSVPDASSTFAAQDAAARAKALQEAEEALNKAGPPSTMSKEQESKAMPLAGQANDHSTAGRDDKPKGPPSN